MVGSYFAAPSIFYFKIQFCHNNYIFMLSGYFNLMSLNQNQVFSGACVIKPYGAVIYAKRYNVKTSKTSHFYIKSYVANSMHFY